MMKLSHVILGLSLASAGGCLSGGVATEERSGSVQEWSEEEGWHEVDDTPVEQEWSEEEGWHPVDSPSEEPAEEMEEAAAASQCRTSIERSDGACLQGEVCCQRARRGLGSDMQVICEWFEYGDCTRSSQ